MNVARHLLMVSLAAAAAPTSVFAASPHESQPLGIVCRAVPEGVTLIIPHSGGVVASHPGGAELLDAPIAAGPNMAFRGPDGSVWVEAAPGGQLGVYRIPAGGPAALIADGAVSLTGFGWLGGRAAAAIIDADGESGPQDPGHGAVLVVYEDGEAVEVSDAAGWEWGTSSATIGADRVMLEGSAEAAEWFASYRADGTALDDWFEPDGSDLPPEYAWPIPAVSADGTRAVLSWAELGDDPGSGATFPWSLVVADAVTAAESLRIDLGEAGERLVHADFDGRFWVGSFADTWEEEPAYPDRVLVVDIQAGAPSVVDAGCPPGATATIDRLGATAPAVPPAAPTTHGPGGAGHDGARDSATSTSRPTTVTRSSAASRASRCSDVQLMLVHRRLRHRDRRILRPGDGCRPCGSSRRTPASRSTVSSAWTRGVRSTTRSTCPASTTTATGWSIRGS